MNTVDSFEIKMLLSVFTVDKGKIKVLLFKRGIDPYKGYWSFPSKSLGHRETFEENIKDLLYEYLGTNSIYFENFKAFKELETPQEGFVIDITCYAIIDVASSLYQTKMNEEREHGWFLLDSIPKMAYHQQQILNEVVKHLKMRLRSSDMICRLFPSDFTLPELQLFCEQLTGEKLDRRNFRKKILSLDILEDTKEMNENGMGRPAKLYKFKDGIENITLF